MVKDLNKLIMATGNYQVFHSHNKFARVKCRVNEIKTFWSYYKKRLPKFNGLTDNKFLLHLKDK